MKKFKIDKNIPLVELYPTCEESPYPFAEMEKGDSFFVEGDNRRDYTGYNILYSQIYKAMSEYRNSVNIKRSLSEFIQFAIRAVDNGWRCWRTK